MHADLRILIQMLCDENVMPNCVTRAPLLYFIRSWVALSFKVCSSVRHRWHLTRSPLCAIYKGIDALCWPSIIKYQMPPPHSVLYWPSTHLHHLLTQLSQRAVEILKEILGPKTAKFGPKLAFLVKYGHFWPIWSNDRPKNNSNKLLRWFFRYVGTKIFTYSHKN